MTTSLTLLLLFSFDYVLMEKCVVYKAIFLDKIKSCPGFDNKLLDADGLNLDTQEAEDDEEGSMTMHGQITLGSDIESGDAIQIDIWRELEIGSKEFVNSARWDICQNLQNNHAPWYPVLECLGVSKCPVPAKDYSIQELIISLASVKDVLCHEFCGTYTTEFRIVNNIKDKSCHVIGMAIVENEEEC